MKARASTKVKTVFFIVLLFIVDRYSLIRFVGLSHHSNRSSSWLHGRLPRCDSPT
uniref:Uncharacterized protein n=1 Tax=uncultured bacterium Rlip1 TaxID=581114 RepID=C0K066_9BACT|nr:unknown [uncultured bacterium Rlip1]